MNIISTEDLTKIYNPRMKKGGIKALNSVSIGIKQGEVFGLLGPNGAGKTTLFKALLGITSITSGSALVNGLPPSNPDSRLKVGYLPENHRFPDHLTGEGILFLTGCMYRMDKNEISEQIDKLLKLVDMTRWRSTKIRKYSKGMMQRIGIAQSMISDPDVIFLDEPTDGVDPVGKTEIREVLKTIRAQGKSIILNSHLLSEVESVADRVAILQHGKLKKIGTIAELTTSSNQYEICAEYGDRLIKIPEDIGTMVHLTQERMVVDIPNEKDINLIIDMLRKRDISIISLNPIKISLEQSFIETVMEQEREQP